MKDNLALSLSRTQARMLMRSRMNPTVYTKIWEEERGNHSFQDCVIKESIRCESVSADLDVMSELTILWTTSVAGVNGLYLNGARKICRTLQVRKIGVQVIIKLGSFLLFQEL